MTYENPHIEFLFEGSFTASDIRGFVELCLELGCTTQEDGGTERGLYLGPPTDYDLVEMNLNQALDHLVESSGRLTLWYDDFSFSVGPGAELAPNISGMNLSIDPVHFKKAHSSEEELTERINTIVNLVAQLYLHSDVLHVVGRSEPIEDDSHVLTGEGSDLRAGCVDAVFWLNIFAPPAVERLGRETLLTAGWKTRELDDGSVLLVLSENPLLFGYLEDRDRLEERLGLRP